MRRIIIAILTLLPAISVRAQDLPDNAAYNACIDSLKKVMSALVEEWNATIPPHTREAIRLEKEAEAHPDGHHPEIPEVGARNDQGRQTRCHVPADPDYLPGA